MKKILIILISTSAFAGDYAQALKQLESRQYQIDQKMRGFGLSSEIPHEEKSDPEKQQSLLQIHNHLSFGYIPAGKLLFGKTHLRLIVGSEAAPAMILMEDRQGITSGLKLLGKARASSTEGRMVIDLDRLLLRSGKAIPIQASVLDESGALGLHAQVFSGKLWAAIGATASGFISGMAASQETITTNAFGFSEAQPGGRNATLQGLAKAASDQSKKLLEDATQEKPILIIESDTSVTVLVNEEVRL